MIRFIVFSDSNQRHLDSGHIHVWIKSWMYSNIYNSFLKIWLDESQFCMTEITNVSSNSNQICQIPILSFWFNSLFHLNQIIILNSNSNYITSLLFIYFVSYIYHISKEYFFLFKTVIKSCKKYSPLKNDFYILLVWCGCKFVVSTTV